MNYFQWPSTEWWKNDTSILRHLLLNLSLWDHILDQSDLSNYCPISNLSFVIKIEKIPTQEICSILRWMMYFRQGVGFPETFVKINNYCRSYSISTVDCHYLLTMHAFWPQKRQRLLISIQVIFSGILARIFGHILIRNDSYSILIAFFY